jgi:hypothetical protein
VPGEGVPVLDVVLLVDLEPLGGLPKAGDLAPQVWEDVLLRGMAQPYTSTSLVSEETP